MITEQEILDAIESLRRRGIPPPERRLSLTPAEFEALRKLPVQLDLFITEEIE